MEEMVEIYRKYMPQVYNFLFSLCHDAHLSEELTQETFFQALKSIDSFRGDCKIYVWLCSIAKHLWYNQCRKNKRIVDTDETFDIEDPQNLEEQFIAGEEKVSLYKKMQNLDEKTREVMYLRITGELSFKEIGEILGKTENWARVTFYRGKSKLKEVDENGKGM